MRERAEKEVGGSETILGASQQMVVAGEKCGYFLVRFHGKLAFGAEE